MGFSYYRPHYPLWSKKTLPVLAKDSPLNGITLGQPKDDPNIQMNLIHKLGTKELFLVLGNLAVFDPNIQMIPLSRDPIKRDSLYIKFLTAMRQKLEWTRHPHSQTASNG
jgi:hypothetical protein